MKKSIFYYVHKIEIRKRMQKLAASIQQNSSTAVTLIATERHDVMRSGTTDNVNIRKARGHLEKATRCVHEYELLNELIKVEKL